MAESAGSMEGKKRKALAALCLLNVIDDDGRHWKRGKTKDWMKRREEKGYVSNIITELSIEDTAAYKEMMRMSHTDFLFLLSLVERDITPQAILGGSPTITPKSRLALTIRFLATGESYRSLRFQFRISTSAISYIVNEVCAAIVKNVGPLYLKVPSSVEEWDEIAARFNELWHYPNCVGALDGKHIVIQPPANSGSHYYNYKHSHSIVLLALAGPNYECLYADVGTNGRVSDGGVWNKCDLSKAIEEKKLLLPEPKCLPFGIEKVPYVVVADEAFALQNFLMKPYPQCGLTDDKRIYNYRHSRARRISENLFGIIANRWRLFRSNICLPPDSVTNITMATLSLHNFLRKSKSKSLYCPPGITDAEDESGNLIQGTWRSESAGGTLVAIRAPSKGHNVKVSAKQVREIFKDYFCNEGAIPWQWNMC